LGSFIAARYSREKRRENREEKWLKSPSNNNLGFSKLNQYKIVKDFP
jgi:hypothetical protein